MGRLVEAVYPACHQGTERIIEQEPGVEVRLHVILPDKVEHLAAHALPFRDIAASSSKWRNIKCGEQTPKACQQRLGTFFDNKISVLEDLYGNDEQ